MRTALATAMLAALAVAGCSTTSAGTSGSATVPAPRPIVAVDAVSPSAAVIARHLHLHGVTVYTAATDPNQLLGRQDEYTSKVNWGADLADSIEVFADPADAQAREQYVSSFPAPFGDGYDYVTGTALLRLSASYTPAQARALETAFRKAVTP